MGKIRFGSGGNADSFYKDDKNKSSLEACRWLFAKGLDAYEYECTRGVRIGKEFAVKLGREAKEFDIALSVHAPYYINLAAANPEKQQASIKYLIQSLEVANWMGATKVVFHPGSGNPVEEGDSREQALERAKKVLRLAVDEGKRLGLLEQVYLSPETMGKANQLGNLAEVLALCKYCEGFVYPTVDWGHLHALGNGCLNTEDDFMKVFETIEDVLGVEACQELHCHFSPIEYTIGGEMKHHTLAEKVYGPDFSLLAKVILRKNYTPTIICESAGTQAEDAVSFKQIYKEIKKELRDRLGRIDYATNSN